MQTRNKVFDDLAKVLTSAAGAAQGARAEMESVLRAHVERMAGELDLVPRDEFEAVKAMAITAREENMRLEARLAAFEARLNGAPEKDAATDAPAKPARRKSAVKKTGTS